MNENAISGHTPALRISAISDAIEADMKSDTEDVGLRAAFTRLSRRGTRPGVLRPDPGRAGNSEPVLTGLHPCSSHDAKAVD